LTQIVRVASSVGLTSTQFSTSAGSSVAMAPAPERSSRAFSSEVRPGPSPLEKSKLISEPRSVCVK
jgi:hypothetical protein